MNDLLVDPVPLPEGRAIPAADWQQTPPSVRHQLLLKRVDALETRLHLDSSTASRPPSTDTLSTKRQRRTKAADRHKPGGKVGHPGHAQVLCEPSSTVARFPEVCLCGYRGLTALTPYAQYTSRLRYSQGKITKFSGFSGSPILRALPGHSWTVYGRFGGSTRDVPADRQRG